jgi:DNA repair protein RadC
MAIHQWPVQEQPREKLLMQGVTILTDAELLAVLIGSGTKGKSAVDVARELLTKTGSLRTLLNYGVTDLHQLPGIGKVTFARMQAALELSRRCLNEKLKRDNVLQSSAATKAFLQAKLQDLQHEVFAGLMLDNQHRVINFEILFNGTLDQSAVYPREIIKRVLKHNAAAIIFVHNHPSGVTTPSQSDVQLTQELNKALKHIGVRLLDHFIVGDGEVISLVEQGLFVA